jgi:hypothetical protein
LSEAPFAGHVARSGAIRLLPSVPACGLLELFLVQFTFGKLRLGVGVAHDLLLDGGVTMANSLRPDRDASHFPRARFLRA